MKVSFLVNSPMNIRIILTLLVFIATIPAAGQTFKYEVFDDDHISPEIHAERRARVIASLTDGSVVAVLAADVRNRQNDVDYEYRQNSNLLYLTGYPHPGAVLLLVPRGIDVDGEMVTEVLFVKERNPEREVWSGVTAGVTEAREVYGMKAAISIGALTETLDRLFGDERSENNVDLEDTLFIDGWATKSVPMPLLGSNLYVDSKVKNSLHSSYPSLTVVPSVDILDAMREIKDTAELRLLRKAIDITLEGHRTAMRGARPNMKEFQIEALMEFAFKNLGAEDVGYPSIVGSSYNACILHYTTNRKETSTGDLILADCGAEYHGYTADVTRTFPMTGKFTPEQTVIYNIVLEAQDAGIEASRVGNEFRAPHNAAKKVIADRLLELGIIHDADSVQRYFMHGTSHYLGLDVHDPGTRGPLKANSVITVEPGIYIPAGSPCDEKWWNIGVRIEDDILITDNGPENLSGALARTIPDIERLMSTSSE